LIYPPIYMAEFKIGVYEGREDSLSEHI